mgnify:CR=1 FL=1
MTLAKRLIPCGRSAPPGAASSTAVRGWVSACVVDVVAAETPEMLLAMSPELEEASATLRLISLVVAVCSSTAAAMVVW